MEKSFYLKTYGCKFNQTDAELIRGILKAHSWQEKNESEAYFFILNSCGVVERTRLNIIKKIKQLKKKNKKVILTGCLPHILPSVCSLVDLSLGPKEILNIDSIVENYFFKKKSKKNKFLNKELVDKQSLFYLRERKKENNVIATVPISEGCLGHCTFCATKEARGMLKSFDSRFILQDIKNVLSQGFKEIDLTAQDVGIYGLDQGRFLLPDLLKKISKIKGVFKVRLGMMSPWSAKMILSKIISLFKHSDKFFAFFHLPLQSGDDRILKMMRRNYRVSDFLKIVEKIKKHFNDFVLSTDIICGFPGEDERAFEKTCFLIKEIEPDALHIFRFSANRLTEKRGIKDTKEFIKKERSRRLFHLWREIFEKKNKKFLNKTFNVLITERRGEVFLSRTNSFRPVILKNGKLGDFVKVGVFDFSFPFLTGRLLKKTKKC